METPRTLITVSRTLPGDIGIREVRIWLDDKLIATLLNQQSVTYELAAGRHTLRAHNTLVGKQIEFDIEAGAQLRFTTSNRSGCGSSLIFLLGAGPIYLSLDREDASQGVA